MHAAIVATSVSKVYRLGRGRTSYPTLRDALRRPWRRSPPAEELRALDDVSFQVGAGEVVGVIGRNGAGKSTLLKILTRITEPTRGEVRLRGRVGSLLEVGTGFHPELTGRDNVYLSGAILGMSRSEMRARFDEIVEFAGVEAFIETPVKHYSSGMYMRLAFAVAAHLESEVLLVDEVLAVGDLEFQRKCLGTMEAVARGGRTVILVSHNMGAIRSLCHRALLLEGGRLTADGPAHDVVDQYMRSAAAGVPLTAAPRTDPLTIERVLLLNARGEPVLDVPPGAELTVEVVVSARAPIERPFLCIGLAIRGGYLFAANNLLDDLRPARLEGTCTFRCRFRSLPLLPQTYFVRMGARASDGATFLMRTQDIASFSISGRVEDLGLLADHAEANAWESAPLLVPYEWQFADGTVRAFQPPTPGPRDARPDEPA